MEKRRWAIPFLTAFLLSWLALVRTDGFSLGQIENPQSWPCQETGQALSSPLDELLLCPFRYLGKGRQSFVFASEDGKWVLKFFKQSYFRDPWYLKWAKKVPFSLVSWVQDWTVRETAKRNLRRHFYFNSYRIALSKAKEETGLLYFHPGTSLETFPVVNLVDRASRIYRIDLNSIPFVLQKKGEPFYPALDDAFQAEGISGICRLLDQFVDLIAFRIGQGIGDADSDIEHNWGVLDGQVLHLDPGRFYFADDLPSPEGVKREWRRATGSFSKWLKKHYPEAEAYLKQRIEANISGLPRLSCL